MQTNVQHLQQAWVVIPTVLTASATPTNPLCSIGTGSIALTVNGGTPTGGTMTATDGYQFLWSNGATTEDISSGLAAGIYTVVVTDDNGCTISASATIVIPTPIVATAVPTNPACSTGTGSIDLTVNGGTPTGGTITATDGYQFSWSNGATTEDISSGLVTGTYTVVVTDDNGCTISTSATIVIPSAVSITSIVATQISCNGGTGSLDLTASGGTGALTYDWSNDGAETPDNDSEDIAGLVAGTYTVTVTDANGCTATSSSTIDAAAAVVAVNNAIANVSCNGLSNGAIDITASGGIATGGTVTTTEGYQYSWAGTGVVATSEDQTGLVAGTYTVTVTDDNGCTTSATYVVTEPTLLTASATKVDVLCNGASTGSIDLTVGGGTSPYDIDWSGSITDQTDVTAAAVVDPSGLSAGTYTATITDANNCTTSVTITINQPNSLELTLTPSAAVCSPATGSITASTIGGNTPYTYDWADLTGTNNGADRTGLTAGTYTVTVTDVNGCATSSSATITINTASTVNAGADQTVCQATPATAIALTGATIGGGATTGTWSIVTGTGTLSTTAAVADPSTVTYTPGTGETANVVLALTANAIAPCPSITDQVTIVINETPTLTATATNGACPSTLPSVSLDIPAVAGYKYDIVVGATYNGGMTAIAGGTVPTADPQVVTAFPTAPAVAGTLYTVRLLNVVTGCYIDQQFTVQGQPVCTTCPVITALTDPADICQGSPIASLVATDLNDMSSAIGTGNGIANVGITFVAFAGAVVPADAYTGGTVLGTVPFASLTGTDPTQVATLTNVSNTLAAGTYQVCAILNSTTGFPAGCRPQVCQTMVVNALPSIAAFSDSPACVGEDITLTSSPSGGSGIYSTFAWTGPSGYTAAIEDPATIALANTAMAGTYNVTITDSNGCTAAATTAVVVNTPPTITMGSNPTVCANSTTASILYTATTGSPTTYSIDYDATAEATGFVDVASTTLLLNPITLAVPANAAAGTYNASITVTNANGCTGRASFSVTITGLPTAAIAGITSYCGVTAAPSALTASGGGTYAWSTGATTAAITPVTSAVGSITYTITVTNGGCTSTASTTVFVNPTATVCSGTNITITGAGCNTTSPYQQVYLLVDAGGNIMANYPSATCNATIPTTGLTGDYRVYALNYDATTPIVFGPGGVTTLAGINPACYNGTTFLSQYRCYTIAPLPTIAPIVVTQIACNGGTGAIAITVTLGTPAYTYNWADIFGTDDDEDRTGLVAGTYTVTVTDANSCTATSSSTINPAAAAVAVVSTITNVSCNGGNNGAINITASGGITTGGTVTTTDGYQYSWSGTGVLATNGDQTGLVAGTYTVTVTDDNGCTTSATYVVTEPTVLSASATKVDVLCNGASTGSINLTATGGTLSGGTVTATEGYQYSWAGTGVVATAEDQTGLAAGAYTVTVTDDNGCTTTVSISITEPSAISITSIVATQISCNGGTGSLNLTASGGTGALTYDWSNDGAETPDNDSEDIAGLAAGTYTVTVTDANSCTATSSSTINPAAAAVAVVSTITNVSCNGGNNGAINITASGGITTGGTVTTTDGYQYSWSGTGVVAASEDQTGLVAGTYTVTVTDDNGCTTSATYVVTEPTVLSASATKVDVLCNGASTGSINLTATGGTLSGGTVTATEGYQYSWAGTGVVATAEDQTGLVAGAYTVTVTDDNGCTTTVSISITEPSAISITSIVATQISCNGGTGSLNLTVSGGTGALTYDWSNDGAETPDNDSEDIAGLAAGTYTVTVTDANSCTATSSSTINPAAAAVAVVSTITNVSCNGGNNGAINITASGGVTTGGTVTTTDGYQYSWSGTGVVAASEDQTGLVAGTYTVTVTDDNGCTTSATYVVTEPTLLTASATKVDVLCNGASTGSIDLTVGGGTSPYDIDWSGSIADQTDVTATAVVDPSGLAAGIYTVTITDANLCTTSVTITIDQPDPLQLTLTPSSAACSPATGSITVSSTTGGTTPYIYDWADLAGTNNGADRTGLTAGTYTVTVTDVNSCSTSASATITINTASTVNAGADQTVCQATPATAIALTGATIGGGATIGTWSIVTGTGTLSSTTAVADPSTVTYTPGAGETGNVVLALTANAVAPCPSITDQVTITIVAAPVITVLQSSLTATCPGATIDIDAATVFTITPASATYVIKNSAGAVVDGNNITVSGTYTVEAINGNCPVVVSAPITVTIPLPITLTAAVDCGTYTYADGKYNVIITGLANGTGNYNVTVGSQAAQTWTAGTTTTLTFTNFTYTGGTGTQQVTVTDANGCSTTTQVLETICGTPPTCDCTQPGTTGGTGIVFAQAAAGTFTAYGTSGFSQVYILTNNTGLILDSNANGLFAGLADAPAGFYNVYAVNYDNFYSGTILPAIADGQNISNLTTPVAPISTCCFQISAPYVTTVATECTVDDVTASATPVNCNGGTNGAIDLTVTGGTTPFAYLWSNTATTDDLTALAAGTYTVTVTYSNGCTTTTSATVTQPTLLTASAVATNVLCNGGNGSVALTVSGGTTGYTYLWDDATASTTQNLASVVAGTYNVTVTDANSCSTTASATVTQPTSVTATIATVTQIVCNGGTGSLDLTASGGTGTLTYNWDSNSATGIATTQDLNGLSAGTYTVTVTDANGCSTTTSATIDVAPSAISFTPTVTDPTCAIPTGSVAVSGITPAAATYVYGVALGGVYSGAAPATDVATATSNLIPGATYTVRVLNTANGCYTDQTVTIAVVLQISAVPSAANVTACKNEPAKTITATGVVGASFTFYDNSQSVLAGPSTTNTYTPSAGNIGSLQPGVYTFYVSTTEVGKCESALVPVSYIIYDAPSAPNIVADQQYCVGQTIANLQVTGVQATNTITWYDEDPATVGANVLAQGINLTTYATGLSNTAAVTEDYYVSQTVNGCESVAVPVTITVNANPNPSITGDLQLCAGESTTLDAGAGYSIYAWSTNQNSQTITVSPTADATYTVTVTNAAGCTAITSTTVTVNPLPVANAGADAVINCTNTTAILTATGGGTYAWSTGDNTVSTTVSIAGTYTVTVTAANGCTDTDEVVVTEDSAAPVAAITSSATTLTCGTTTISLTATGGGTYAWSTTATTAAINVTTAGTYTVTVTAANGCTDTAEVTITQDITAPIAGITAPVTQLSCTTTSATLTATGGGTYVWSTTATNAAISVTTVGTYTVTVTAANGCTDTEEVTITQDITVPIVSIAAPSVLTCATTVTLSATGGGTYAWSTPNGNIVSGGTTATPVVDAAGTYLVTVTGASGCTAQSLVVVTQNITPPVADAGADAVINCTNTTATLTATGGGTYAWSTGDNTVSTTVSVAGTYTVTVTAANGCTDTDEVVVTQDVVAPVAAINSSASTLTCATTTISLTATGGGTYAWSTTAITAAINVTTAGTYTVTVTAANGCTDTAEVTITQDITAPIAGITAPVTQLSCTTTSATLTATGGGTYVWSTTATNAAISVTTVGTYTVTVTAANGCTDTEEVTITQDITVPIVSIATPSVLTCATTTVTLSATGGGTYAWSTPNGNIVSGGTTATPIVDAAGTYLVTVTGASGCTAQSLVVVTQNITPPVANAGNDVQILCGSTSTVLTATGVGTYAWSTGDLTASATVNAAGTYTVTVTAANGCTATDEVTVTVATCGSIGDYVWADTNGDGIQDATETGINGVTITLTLPNGTTQTTVTANDPITGLPGWYEFTDLPAGNYTVTVGTDPNGGTLSTAGIDNVVLGVGENYVDADFGFTTLGSIGDYVWADTNGDGIQDATETGINGVTITLTLPNGTTQTTVTTNDPITGLPGWYEFTDLPAGNYTVTVGTDPNGGTLSTAGIDNVVLGVGENYVDADFGFTTLGSIGDYVWADTNGDGIQDATETGINGVTITLTLPNGTTQTTVTANDPITGLPGWYEFTDLPAGNYTVTVGTDPNGGTLSTAGIDNVVLGVGENYVDADFGFTTLGSIGDYVWADTNGDGIQDATETGINGVAVTLTLPNGTTQTIVTTNDPITGLPGWYEFSDLPAGEYTVTVGSGPAGTNLSTNGTVTVTLTPGQIFTDADFGFTQCGANVSDIPDQEICEGDGGIDANLSFPLEPYSAIYGPAPTPAANYTLAYVLTTNSDVIINSQIMVGAFNTASNTPNFTYSGLAAGVYRMYEIIYRTSDGPLTGLTVGGNISGISLTTGTCLDATYGNIYVNAKPIPQVINNNGNLCEGATITLIVGGGVSYQWEYPNGTVNASTTSPLLTITNATTADGGVYTVTVTNADGCTASATTTVVVNSIPTATAVATNVLCNGTATGSITLTTNGATYLWSNGATSQNLTNVVAGTYTVTVSNGNCSTTTSATITQPATAVTASATSTVTTCGAANGTITVTATGGTVGTGYTYAIVGASQSNNVFSGLASGSYTITVTDGNACTTTTIATVGASTALTASVVATDVNCNGQANGSVNLTVSGATQPYTYAWSNGITTEDLTNVAAGTYTVTVTSGTCTTTASATVAQPAALTASATVNAAGCSGGVGAIDLTTSGGNGGYTYLWSNGATTEDISNVTAGTYSVLVTDSKNCATTTTATVTQSTPIVVTAIVTKTIACNGETGEVTVSATGGSGIYTSGTGTIISVSAGTYTYTVTDSNGCTGTTTITVTEPTLLTASSVINNATCYGGNGNVDVTVNGGTQAYTYLWSNGATTEDLLAAVAGIYTITVTDANGCTVGLSATVTEPVRIGITVDGTTPATCGQTNGSVDISVSGGTLSSGANYAYNWSNGTTTQDLSNVDAAIYIVTVTDSNGCTATATAQVTTPTGFTAGIVSTQNIACSDGAINVDASGSNLTYAWSGPGGFTAATQDLSGLTTVGTYTLVVTDANSCSISTSATITQANIPINNTGPSCENTVITIGFAGVGPVGTVLNYAWSGPNGYSFTGTYTLTGADIITVSLSNLQITDAGLYTVTITYPGGCTRVASTLVKVDGLPIINSANVTCNGTVGTITVDAESANQINGVQYAIGNGAFQTSNVFSGLANGTYTITVSDAISNCATTTSVIVNCAACPVPLATNNGPVCVGSPLSLSANANLPVGVTATYLWNGPAGTSTQQNPNLGLATIGKAGTYTVTVTYSNGCTATATTVVVVNVKPTITAATPSCVAGVGRIMVTATGTGLTYSIGGAPQASNVFNNVPNGNYTVTVTNAAGCIATASVTVNCTTCPTPVATNNGPVCVGSPINLFVNANLPVGVTATYAWAGPAGSSTLQNPVIVNATPAKAGTYTVTVTYSNGCTATATTLVVVNVKPVITAATPSCVAGVGRITVTATGTGLTYSIGGAPQASNVFNGVANGTYTVTVTNGAGCTATANVTVNCITCPTPVATNNGPVCAGSPINLFANANLPTGVTATYAWAGPAGTSTLQNPVIVNATPAKAGTYTVTVTYSNGCTATATTTVVVSAAPTVSISGPASFCVGSSATLTATGGGTYAWSNGGITASTNVIAAGTYTVTVTNASGCTKTATKTVTATALPTASANVVCDATGGTVIISGTGTSFNLNGVIQSSNVFTNVANGTYIVIVSNAAGCSTTTSVTVNCNLCSASVGAVTVNNVVCPGDPFIASTIFNSPATGYANYILVVNAAGTIVEVVPATSGTQVTLSTSAAGTYNVYAYSIQTPNGGTIPTVGTNVSAISGNCYSLSNPPQQVVLPELPLLLVGYQNSDEGYEGGITPFHYNTDTILIIGGIQPYNFDWEIEGYVRYDITYTETGAEIVIYYSDDAQWNAIVTDSYGCSNDTLLFTNMQGGAAGNTILDIDSYVVTPSSDYIAPDGTITLNITGGDPSSCAEGYTYEWAGPDTWDGVYGTSTGVPVANGEQYTLTDLPMGWYSVTVTDCVGNITEGWYWVQSGHRGRTKTDARVTMNVMPNPMSDAATISFVVPTTDNVTVNVYSVDGKQMAALYNDRASAEVVYTLPLNAAQLPAGMYFVRLTTASGLTEIQKIVVNR
jgi:uncharacterized protein (DUF2141 family)